MSILTIAQGVSDGMIAHIILRGCYFFSTKSNLKVYL
jgi:hypothetical protein